MDGKNVFDFVDPDILAKLERIEQEEEEFRNKMNEEDMVDEESEELSEDLIEAHEEVMENKKTIREKHSLVTGSQLPRKLRDLTATEKFMEKINVEKKEALSNIKMLSQKKRRETKERLKKSLLNESMRSDLNDEDEEDDDFMEIDEDQPIKKFKKSKLSAEEIEEQKKKEKIEHQKQMTVERLKRKIQKGWNRESRIDDTDRKIASKLPKHLNTGKRGIGKTQRR